MGVLCGFLVEAPEEATALEVKKKIEQQEGYPAKDFRFIINGVALKDEDNFARAYGSTTVALLTPIPKVMPHIKAIKTNDGQKFKELLLEDPTYVNTTDSHSGKTPLLLAIEEERWDIVDEILRSDQLDLNKKMDETTFLASQKGRKDIVESLIHKGVDPNQVYEEKTLLHSLVEQEHYELAVQLLQRKDIKINERNSKGETILHLLAAKETNKSGMLFETLPQIKGIDLNAARSDGQTPLHILIDNDTPEGKYMFEKLVQKESINPNAVNKKLQTPLHLAAKSTGSSSDWKITKLLENNADVNAVDSIGETPLHKSAHNDRFLIKTPIRNMEALLQGSAIDINEVNYSGETALHIIAREPEEYIKLSSDKMKLLINHGANSNLITKEGDTILMLSLKKSFGLTYTILDPNNNFCFTCFNAQDSEGNNALHLTANLDGVTIPELIQKLLQLGVDPKAANKKGDSPLHVASRVSERNRTTLLPACDDKLKNKSGQTPLELHDQFAAKEQQQRLESEKMDESSNKKRKYSLVKDSESNKRLEAQLNSKGIDEAQASIGFFSPQRSIEIIKNPDGSLRRIQFIDPLRNAPLSKEYRNKVFLLFKSLPKDHKLSDTIQSVAETIMMATDDFSLYKDEIERTKYDCFRSEEQIKAVDFLLKHQEILEFVDCAKKLGQIYPKLTLENLVRLGFNDFLQEKNSSQFNFNS